MTLPRRSCPWIAGTAKLRSPGTRAGMADRLDHFCFARKAEVLLSRESRSMRRTLRPMRRVRVAVVFVLIALAVAGVAGCGGGISTTTATVTQDNAPSEQRSVRKQEAIREQHRNEKGLKRLLLVAAREVESCLREDGYTGTVEHYRGFGVVAPTPSGTSLVVTGLKGRHGIFYIGVASSHHAALEYLYTQMEEIAGGSERRGSYSGSVAIVRDQLSDPLYQGEFADVRSCASGLPTTAGQFKDAPLSRGGWNRLLPSTR
jgi:hypothetical protein